MDLADAVYSGIERMQSPRLCSREETVRIPYSVARDEQTSHLNPASDYHLCPMQPVSPMLA
jgi:hypothetical protein